MSWSLNNRNFCKRSLLEVGVIRISISAGIDSIPMLLYIGIDTLDVQLDSPAPDLSRNTLTDESAPGSQSRPDTFPLFTPPNSLTRPVSLSPDPLPAPLLAISVPPDRRTALVFFFFFDATLGQHTRLQHSALDSAAADRARRWRVTLFHLNRRVGDQTSDCDSAMLLIF